MVLRTKKVIWKQSKKDFNRFGKRKEQKKVEPKLRSWYRYILLADAIALLGIGIMQKEYMIVFKKAVNICLECIGVG